jgi:hypothetical protein
LPVIATLVIAAAVAPVFATVVLDAVLVFPVVVTGNVNDVGVKVSVVAAPAMLIVAHRPASIRMAYLVNLETPAVNSIGTLEEEFPLQGSYLGFNACR